MKLISDVIKELEALKAEHGDIRVGAFAFWAGDMGYATPNISAGRGMIFIEGGCSTEEVEEDPRPTQ